MYAEDNHVSETKGYATEEEEEEDLQFNSKPYTQLDRRVVSVEVAASAAPALVQFPSFSGYPQPYFERRRNRHGASRRRPGQEGIQKEKEERWKQRDQSLFLDDWDGLCFWFFFPSLIFPSDNYNMPTAAEFASGLQKIKYGFNLLVRVHERLLFAASWTLLFSLVMRVSVLVQAELNGQISNPTAPDYVHYLFSALASVSEHIRAKFVHLLWTGLTPCPFLQPPSQVAPHSPVGLPMTIVVPLLTPACVQLLKTEVTPEEEQLWLSLGDAWNIPRWDQDLRIFWYLACLQHELMMCLVDTSSNQWPHGDIQPYLPEFLDGWQPPQLSATPEPERSLSRVEALQPASSRVRALGHIWGQRETSTFLFCVFFFFFLFTADISQVETTTAAPRRSTKVFAHQHSPNANIQSLNASDTLRCSSSPAEPQYMRVVYDFTSRNSKELTVRRGETVEASVHETKAGCPCLHPRCNITAAPSLPAAAGHVQAVVEGAKRSGGGGLRAQQRPGAG